MAANFAPINALFLDFKTPTGILALKKIRERLNGI
jgi:hypothetical protein